jgi:hypothetical protein
LDRGNFFSKISFNPKEPLLLNFYVQRQLKMNEKSTIYFFVMFQIIESWRPTLIRLWLIENRLCLMMEQHCKLMETACMTVLMI